VGEHAEAIAGAAISAAEGNLYQHQTRKREDTQLAQRFSNIRRDFHDDDAGRNRKCLTRS
jgi:hypothetical protein